MIEMSFKHCVELKEKKQVIKHLSLVINIMEIIVEESPHPID